MTEILSPTFRQDTYNLKPGEGQDYHAFGTTFGCLEATAHFRVKFDNNPLTWFQKGISVTGPGPFGKVRFENPHAFAIDITIFTAQGTVNDARLVLPEDLTAFTGAARSTLSSSVEVGSGQRVEIAPAHLDRQKLIVTNMGTKPVFLGDANVHWKKGLPLAAGSTATLEVQSALYAYAQASGIQTLAILETRK